MQLHPIEKALLTSAWDASIPVTAAADLVKLAVDADFGAVLTGPDARRVLQVAETSDPKALDRLISLSPPKNKEEELVLVALAVAALHAFLQANWTGPDLAFTAEDVLNSSVPASTLNALAVSELALGGEPAYHLCASPFLLRLAQLLLELPFAHTPSVPWWRLRLANVHLQILDEAVPPPPALLAELAELRAHLPAIDTDLAGALLLEEGLLQHRLGDDKAAAPLFVRAARATGLEYELTGALGKRTKFQQFDITQLVLLAESRKRAGDSKPEGEASEEADKAPAPTPETLALNDDTLLERTQFTSSSAGPGTSTAGTARLAHIDPNAQPALHPLDTAILLALCLNVRNTSPADGLTGEQMAPYVARALSHARNWSVHTLALLLRTRLEAHRTRTVERAVLQLQALVDQMPSADASVPERLRLLHALALPSKWELERELATRLLSLGVVRSALEIFERLEMWEEAVGCHQALGGKDTGVVIVRDLLTGGRTEAAAVLRREKDALEGEPDAKRAARTRTLDVAREAKLWCLLGDLEPERAREHYAHAWELSGHTSGRAVRSLGGLHFTAGRFAEAIPCLRAALAINPLLSRSWFVLGCACTREEDWAGARDAFTRCVAIDDTDAESWNNLASAYLRLSAEESKVWLPAYLCHTYAKVPGRSPMAMGKGQRPRRRKLMRPRRSRSRTRHSRSARSSTASASATTTGGCGRTSRSSRQTSASSPRPRARSAVSSRSAPRRTAQRRSTSACLRASSMRPCATLARRTRSAETRTRARRCTDACWTSSSARSSRA
jgi:tetratricopeptide (TPR) repeat protein